MRLVRVVALFGSVMLLVATLASLVNQRGALYREQDDRVSATVVTASNSVQTTLMRARSIVTVAAATSDPAALTSTFADAAEACVDTRCSGPDIAALAAFGTAVSNVRAGTAVVVVDEPSESVVIIGRSDEAIVSIQLPVDALVGPLAQTAIAELDTEFSLQISGAADGTDEGTGGPTDGDALRTVDGRRVGAVSVSDQLDQGSVLVEASAADDVGWGAGSPGTFALLFAFGTVMLALAAWSFRVEGRKLERRATTDDLTGLVNRREFERQSELALDMAHRFGTPLCVMLIDLNGFKQVNDTLGHQFGDLVLKACAERLVDAVRDTDLVGRWGGDEFVVLLPTMSDASGVRASAERIGARLSSSPVAGDVSITGSIGAALYPRHGTTLSELLQAADVAMYEAKTTGVVHRLSNSTGADRALPPPSYDGPDRRRASSVSDESLTR